MQEGAMNRSEQAWESLLSRTDLRGHGRLEASQESRRGASPPPPEPRRTVRLHTEVRKSAKRMTHHRLGLPSRSSVLEALNPDGAVGDHSPTVRVDASPNRAGSASQPRPPGGSSGSENRPIRGPVPCRTPVRDATGPGAGQNKSLPRERLCE